MPCRFGESAKFGCFWSWFHGKRNLGQFSSSNRRTQSSKITDYASCCYYCDRGSKTDKLGNRKLQQLQIRIWKFSRICHWILSKMTNILSFKFVDFLKLFKAWNRFTSRIWPSAWWSLSLAIWWSWRNSKLAISKTERWRNSRNCDLEILKKHLNLNENYLKIVEAK